MKEVSFEVAKALKEAGYPQGNTAKCYLCYLTADLNQFYKKGQIVDNEEGEWATLTSDLVDIPTYLDVWFWLWRERKIEILPAYDEYGCVRISFGQDCEPKILRFHNGKSVSHDPEEAIIAGIEYLVENDLIK